MNDLADENKEVSMVINRIEKTVINLRRNKWDLRQWLFRTLYWKEENKYKRGREWPIFKTMKDFDWLDLLRF